MGKLETTLLLRNTTLKDQSKKNTNPVCFNSALSATTIPALSQHLLLHLSITNLKNEALLN
ncbi:hypothetical protein PI23P_10765 [Polaribacter irgensii 23-P]|uniref:Uncharacterized protein n=1 Tax=Polaribacter irgensii 23-P TaxID=313594 RepID=A4C112_9FLAO|nr:hypothetical protein PI23P_10765 [Polaribacter irgensii 23-P]